MPTAKPGPLIERTPPAGRSPRRLPGMATAVQLYAPWPSMGDTKFVIRGLLKLSADGMLNTPDSTSHGGGLLRLTPIASCRVRSRVTRRVASISARTSAICWSISRRGGSALVCCRLCVVLRALEFGHTDDTKIYEPQQFVSTNIRLFDV